MNALERLDPASVWLPYEPSAETPWTHELAAHLFRRAAFGAQASELTRALADGPQATVDRLLDPDGVEAFDQSLAQAANLLGAGDEAPRVQTWWLYRMRHSPDPLSEQLVLFLHNHFATSADKVRDAELLLRQNQLFRQHCRGSFRPLLKAIAKDPAMLIYLDCTENRKRQPNENFAREVMELFTLGLDEYTQADIRELAKCFTGTEVRRRDSRFNPYEHDSGIKTFLGGRGHFDGALAIDELLRQPVASRFLATKLIRWFLCDDPIDQAYVAPLANILRTHDFKLRVAVETILRSRLFYSSLAVGQQVRSPVSLVVGWLRSLNANIDFRQALLPLKEMGQAPLYPPNVAGWPNGLTWMNSQWMIARCQWIAEFARSSATRFSLGDADATASSLGASPRKRLEQLERLLLAMPLTEPAREQLVQSITPLGLGDQLRTALELLAVLPQTHLA